MNKLEEEIKDSIYMNGSKDDGKYILTLSQLEQVGREAKIITTDVAVKFLTFMENNYYYNSGCWLNCETDEVKAKKEIFEEFINNHYGK